MHFLLRIQSLQGNNFWHYLKDAIPKHQITECKINIKHRITEAHLSPAEALRRAYELTKNSYIVVHSLKDIETFNELALIHDKNIPKIDPVKVFPLDRIAKVSYFITIGFRDKEQNIEGNL